MVIIPTSKPSKWQHKQKAIVHKFAAVKQTREQTEAFWDSLALPRHRPHFKVEVEKPKPSKKKEQAKSAYKAVDERDKGCCQFPGCGKRNNVNHHHIIFRSQGGKNHVQNIVTLCPRHHTLGKDSPHQSAAWRKFWEGWAEDRYPEYWREIREREKIGKLVNSSGQA